MSWFSELKSKVDESLAAQRAENDARLAREYEAEQAKKATELKTKTAESAKYLNADVTPNKGGSPQIVYDGFTAQQIRGADGNLYYFAPREFVNRGQISKMDGKDYQFYNARFLDKTVFDKAQQFTSPDGTPGFVWKMQDAIDLKISNKEGLPEYSGYDLSGGRPPIVGIGYPNATGNEHLQTLSYVSMPQKVSDRRVEQNYIINNGADSSGASFNGNRGYEYYVNGWLADRARAGLPTVNALMPIVFEIVYPGTGAGAVYAQYSAATAAGIQALTTGNLEQGVVDLAKIYATGKVSDLISQGINWSMPVDTNAVARTILGGAGTNAVVQGLYGKDIGKAFVDGGIQAGVNAVAGSISGFGDLPKPVQKVFNAAVVTNLQGKSGKQIDAATLQAAISAGLGAIANGIDANAKIQKEFGREATPEELNKFIWYTDRNAFNREFDTFAADTKSSQASAQQAAIDEQNRLDAEAAAQAKAQADEQAAIDAEVAAQAQAQADAQAKAQADEQAAIDAEVAAQAQAQADAQAAIDAETARAAQEAKEAEEQAKRVAEFGKDLTGGGNQDLGEVDTDTDFYDKDSTGKGAYKYDPETGNYTFTADDGSTITIDKDTNIVGVTEATDTPWTGITDTKTGNLKLPKLPSGKVPVIPATAVKPTKPAEPDPLAAILGQQQTPVTYQTVTPELAKVFYGGQDFSSTPQKLNEQGQLEQQNPLLKEPNFVDPTKPLEQSFANPQQTLNAQGQLAQRYSLLDEPNFLDPTKPLASSALAPQGNPKENDVAAMLTKIMGGRGNPTSQEELLKILGRA